MLSKFANDTVNLLGKHLYAQEVFKIVETLIIITIYIIFHYSAIYFFIVGLSQRLSDCSSDIPQICQEECRKDFYFNFFSVNFCVKRDEVLNNFT